ncbi:hypothetical protein ACIQWZ_28275 [Streptomyces sp. NPDC098077]|uniref:hypothetical protein n=1 Tax=Streptomyces sp. NPDC098077 TaxID=3366093 RepID=UPI00380CD4B4
MKIAVAITAAVATALIAVPLAGALAESPKPSTTITTGSVDSVLASTAAPLLKLPTRPCSDDNAITRSCYWDAAKMGNGKGHSYVVDAQGNVIYLNPKLNQQDARLKFNDVQSRAGKEHWGTVDGHRFCWAKVGDTSYIQCFDGYKTTS